MRHVPKSWTKNVAGGSAFGGANLITFDDVAQSLMLDNRGSADVEVRLNGDADCTFYLEHGTSINFGVHDVHVTSVDFRNNGSGAVTQQIVIIAGLRSDE